MKALKHPLRLPWLPFAALAALAAALLVATACMPPPPPHFQRPPMAPRVKATGKLGLQAQAGFNANGVQDRASRGQYQASGFNTSGVEGSFRARVGLPFGIEAHAGLGGPDIIPFTGFRWQVLGSGWEYGPIVTLDAGLNAVPDAYAGLSLGADFGVLEPYVSARSGEWRGETHVPYNEAEIGVALEFQRLRVLARYGARQNSSTQAMLSQGMGIALELSPMRRPRAARTERRHREAERVLGRDESNDPCFSLRPADVFNPDQWDAYSVCQEQAGDLQSAMRSAAYALKLRQKPVFK